MTARDVAAVAFGDQVDAACRDLLVTQLDAMAQLGVGQLRYPAPAVRRLLGRFAGALLADELTTCEHLAGAPRRPAWCAADDVRVLRCAPCLTRHLRRPGPLPGCDGCTWPGELRALAAVTAPVVHAVLDGHPASVPPVVLLGGLCSTCWSTPAARAAA